MNQIVVQRAAPIEAITSVTGSIAALTSEKNEPGVWTGLASKLPCACAFVATRTNAKLEWENLLAHSIVLLLAVRGVADKL